jgi:hypothetical protein
MKVILTIVSLMLCMSAGAETFDWLGAEAGVQYEQSNAFSGCAKAESVADQKARKVAILKAQANMSRARYITIAGEEHLFGVRGNDRYGAKIVETTETFIAKLSVVKEEFTQIDNGLQLCVLVAEN